MSEPFLGEIRAFSFGRVPNGWALCNGQLLAINGNQALFSLLGNTYGGDGRTTFALPDLRGRTPVHFGNGVALGQSAGEEAHTLTVNEMPAHTHQVTASSTSSASKPAGNYWGATPSPSFAAAPNVTMSPSALGTAGKSAAHPNMQPYNVLSFCIATVGIYPTRN